MKIKLHFANLNISILGGPFPEKLFLQPQSYYQTPGLWQHPITIHRYSNGQTNYVIDWTFQ